MQTVGSLFERLKDLLEKGEVSKSTPLVASSDDEGNSFGYVQFAATVGKLDGFDFSSEQNAKGRKVVCIN